LAVSLFTRDSQHYTNTVIKNNKNQRAKYRVSSFVCLRVTHQLYSA